MKVNAWRVSAAHDGRGLLMYFDPFLEDVSLRLLTAPERASRLTELLSVSAFGPMDDAPLDLDYVENHMELFDGTS